MSDIKCYVIEVPYTDMSIGFLEDEGRFELFTFDSGIPEMWVQWLSETVGLEPIRFRSDRDGEGDGSRHWWRIAPDGTPTSIPTSNVLFDYRKHKARAEKVIIDVFESD